METLKTLNAQLKKAEKANSKEEVKTLKQQIKEAKEANARAKAEADKKKEEKKPKAKKDVYSTDYGKEVLTVNKALKAYERTFKGALKRLVAAKDELPITRKQTIILNAAAEKQGKNLVNTTLDNLTRRHSSGTCSPFYILQAIKKHQNRFVIKKGKVTEVTKK